MKTIKTQFGTSISADFDEQTWTFKIPEDFSVSAGEFAIIDKATYEELIRSSQTNLKTKDKLTTNIQSKQVATPDEKHLLPAVFRHIPTGNSGFFIKDYKPTGKPLTMQIKLLNNRIWFAPKCEFERLRSR